MYEVIIYSRKWKLTFDSWFYPKTEEGLRLAREKRSELMAKYLDNDVEIHECDTLLDNHVDTEKCDTTAG